MAYVTPKLDWSVIDGVTYDDMNRIEGNTAAVKVTADAALPKAGGIMTGDVSSAATNFQVKDTNTAGTLILAAGEATQMAVNCTFDGTNWNRIDIAKVAYRARLGTTSGQLEFFRVAAGANPITWVGPFKFWNSDNDGSGSGLDADTVKGYVPLNKAGDNMGGTLGLATFSGTNEFQAGTADNASYTLYNFALKGWYGMAMKTYDNSVNGYYDFRAGYWVVKGGFRVNDGTTTNFDVNSNGDITQRGTVMAPTRVTSGSLEFWDGSTWKVAGGVNSVQRGYTLAGNPTNVTISSVNMSKSFVTCNTSSNGALVTARLTSSTNLELVVGTGSLNVAWEVVEFY